MNVSRVALVPIAVLAWALFLPAGSAAADPPPTQVITVVAVGPDGQAINGYRVAAGPDSVGHASECSQPSPSAVDDNVYYCSPSAAGAGTCWPSTSGSLLCVDNPWDRQMHRVTFDGQLAPVRAPAPRAAVAQQAAGAVVEGQRERVRVGGYVGVYGCGGAGSDLAVLWQPSQGRGSCIDRSAPAWTVKVGRLGAPDAVLPPPATRTVTAAWLAGGRAGQ